MFSEADGLGPLPVLPSIERPLFAGRGFLALAGAFNLARHGRVFVWFTTTTPPLLGTADVTAGAFGWKALLTTLTSITIRDEPKYEGAVGPRLSLRVAVLAAIYPGDAGVRRENERKKTVVCGLWGLWSSWWWSCGGRDCGSVIKRAREQERERERERERARERAKQSDRERDREKEAKEIMRAKEREGGQS